MRVKKGDVVTIVDRESKNEYTGIITEYTIDSIIIEEIFDSKKVYFKDKDDK